MAPFNYTPFVNPFSGDIASLMQRGPEQQAEALRQIGEARARAASQSGAAWAGAAQGIGSSVAGAIQTATDPRTQLARQQVVKGNVEASDLAALDKAYTMPGGRDQILSALPGHLRPQVAAGFVAADEGAAKAQKAELDADTANGDYLNTLAEQVKAHGYDPTAAQLALSHAGQTFVRNPSLLSQVQQLTAQLQANPSVETVKSLVDPILAGHDAQAKNVVLPSTPRGGAPAKIVNPATGEVKVSGDAAPAQPQTAVEADNAIRALYGKRAMGEPLTPQETAAIKGYEDQKGANDAPITVKTMENGKPVEKVMTRAQALAAGAFPSQPPASVQVLNQMGGPGGEASASEKAVGDYKVAPPSARSMATPAGKAMMDRILAYNPEYDASMFSVRAPTRKAFTTGTQGQQITAMNTAIEHLDQLQAAADALKNGEFKPGNAAYQYLKATFGDNAPTNYDTIKAMVDHEVEAVANKGVPTVSGTAQQQALAGKSASPEQLKGYIDTLIPLMGSKLNALHYQYTQAMGKNDPFTPITPEAQDILTKRGFDPTNPTAKGGTASAPDLSTLAPGHGRTFTSGPFKGTWTVGPDGKAVKVGG